MITAHLHRLPHRMYLPLHLLPSIPIVRYAYSIYALILLAKPTSLRLSSLLPMTNPPHRLPNPSWEKYLIFEITHIPYALTLLIMALPRHSGYSRPIISPSRSPSTHSCVIGSCLVVSPQLRPPLLTTLSIRILTPMITPCRTSANPSSINPSHLLGCSLLHLPDKGGWKPSHLLEMRRWEPLLHLEQGMLARYGGTPRWVPGRTSNHHLPPH